MRSLAIPSCPKCIDGGRVELVKVRNELCSIFQPLPEGQMALELEYRCGCGWVKPVEQPVERELARC